MRKSKKSYANITESGAERVYRELGESMSAPFMFLLILLIGAYQCVKIIERKEMIQPMKSPTGADGKPPETYLEVVMCWNCGKHNYCWIPKGTSINTFCRTKTCEKCGCGVHNG